MLKRRLGLETEYALHFHPGADHPGNATLYQAMVTSMGRLVTLAKGDDDDDSWFTEHGAKLSFETATFKHIFGIPSQSGLLEMGTPECVGPDELLLFQKAQDQLLTAATEGAEEELKRQGFPGELRILKNCKDPEGDGYGAQENYEVVVARGLGRALWLLACALWMPVMLLGSLAATLAVYGMMAVLFVDTWRATRTLRDANEGRARFDVTHGRTFAFHPSDAVDIAAYNRFAPRAKRYGYALLRAFFIPLAYPLKTLAFRRERERLLSFLVSRIVVTGAGTLDQEGRFRLSEKGTLVTHLNVTRADAPGVLSLYDLSPLTLGVLSRLVSLRPWRALSLFSRRQRLQLGLSDANLCEVAELLKTGTTSLLLDLCDAGALRDAPRLKDPVRALQQVNQDPSLTAALELLDGTSVTALDLQHWYLAAARRFVEAQPVASFEVREILRLWGETLDGLAESPLRLVGRVDWVTKKMLLDEAGADATFPVRKKIDLRYHELGSGYFARLDEEGFAQRLVTSSEAWKALRSTTSDARARARARMIRALVRTPEPFKVNWTEVTIGRGWKKRVVFLADHRV